MAQIFKRIPLLLFILLLDIVPVLAISSVKVNASPTITEYPVPTPNSNPGTIASSSDGLLWFTETLANKIGRITTSGSITEYPIPTPDSRPRYITTGPDGAAWFTEDFGNKIGRISSSGLIQEYPIPISGGFPSYITAGPGGTVWLIEYEASTGKTYLMSMTEGGSFNQYLLSSSYTTNVGQITFGPDGALWFGESYIYGNSCDDEDNWIIRMTTSGISTTYPLAPGCNAPGYITTGPDGALWFTKIINGTGAGIDRITTTGQLSEYQIPGSNVLPGSIVSGPDGALWFTESGSGEIGRLDTTGAFTSYLIPTPYSGPEGITNGRDNNLWFTEGVNKIGRLNLNLSPSSPTNLNISSPTQLPKLTWNTVNGADSYNIYRNGIKVGSSAIANYTDTSAPEGTESYYVTAVNSGGESTSSNTVSVLVDRTAPSITATQSPAANSDGWNNSSVTVSFACSDSGSGIQNCSPPVTLSDEGAGQSVTGTAVDKAGNVATVTVSDIDIDKTAPTITYSVAPAANSNGWNNSDVTVTFHCSDALSGIKDCTAPMTVHEGANQSVTGTATDKAGNTASITASNINVDETAPTVSAATLTNPSVVYGSKLSTAFAATAADALSGVTSGEYFVDTDPGQGNGTSLTYANNQLSGNADFSSLAVGTHTLYIRAQDKAGNWSAPASATFAVSYPIPVAPTSLTAVTPTNKKISLSWAASFDPSTPPAVSYNIYRNGSLIGTSTTTNFTDSSLTGDGTYSYYVTTVNEYGVESSPSNPLVAVYDTTRPTVIYTLTPAANSNGWNNSNVTVNFSCSDNLSGVQSCPAQHVFSNEGAGQSFTTTASDNAGNVTNVTVSGVNIDKTAPMVSNVKLNGLLNTPIVTSLVPVTIAANASDNLSGVVGGEYYIDTDPGQGHATPLTYSNGQLTATATISGLSLGTHTLYIRAQDAAGNWSVVASVQFTFVI